MDKTQIVVNVVGSIFVLVIAVGALLLLRNFMRRLQNGQGAMGSVLHENRELSKERLQVERELLAAQRQTNELLKELLNKKQT